MTVHNPVNVKLSPKDIKQGWRFCFVEELARAIPADAMYQIAGDFRWTKSLCVGLPIGREDMRHTYVTQQPVPVGLAPFLMPQEPKGDDLFSDLEKLMNP